MNFAIYPVHQLGETFELPDGHEALVTNVEYDTDKNTYVYDLEVDGETIQHDEEEIL